MSKKDKAKQVSEIIYGVHPIIELLKAKRRKLISIYTTKPEPKAWDQLEKLMPKYPVPVQYVSRDVLAKLAGSTDHQGIVAWVQKFPYRTKFFDPKNQKFIVMLEGIQDPHNLGAILRSAYCTGAQGAILIQKGSCPLSAAAIKSSAGLAEHMELFLATSPQAAIMLLKEAGYNIYMAVFNGTDANKCDFKEPLCLVVGGEGFGISKSIIKDGIPVTIAQRTPDISYNASVAAGILLFLISTKNKVI
ncbi:MAG: hypothetical protein ACD_82C00178G0002 [uncultured bacterium]|nr:MAG: hypothetical protein ACD_82C00178G0002 [uncultured bacterium]KKP25361.1 MAG: RNA methyltransferase, TrmH family, group 3 [candidate division TM6 bacterium GW2011_GWF2_30_66]